MIDEETLILDEQKKCTEFGVLIFWIRRHLQEMKTRSSFLCSAAQNLEMAECDVKDELDRLKFKLSELRGE